jgi:hypothetical protein
VDGDDGGIRATVAHALMLAALGLLLPSCCEAIGCNGGIEGYGETTISSDEPLALEVVACLDGACSEGLVEGDAGGSPLAGEVSVGAALIHGVTWALAVEFPVYGLQRDGTVSSVSVQAAREGSATLLFDSHALVVLREGTVGCATCVAAFFDLAFLGDDP